MAAASLAASISLAAFLRAEDPGPKPYDVVTLADGVYGFVWRDPLQNPIEGNALFVVNDRDVLVVDTGILPSTARRMASELRKRTSKPVRYVVNTHWHADHHYGNFVYRELWPEVEFVAHPDTREDLLSQEYAQRPKDLANLERNVAKYERWAKEGKDDEGKPLDEARRKRAADIAAAYRVAIPELRTVKEAPPDLTFVDRLVFHRGARTIEVLWLGRGNTRGDVVVFLPKERIVATGDLLVAPIPFGIGSYYEQWIATLGKLDALPADVLFPGHGPVQRDREYLHRVQGLLGGLVERVKASAAAGETVEDVKKKVTLDDWKTKLAGDDPVKQRAFDLFFVQPAVERAWRQAKGEPDRPVVAD